jgi:alpha,alpha-trehalase
MSAAEAMPTIVEDDYDAWLFDLDGVITDTAVWHGLTWKQVFDEFLDHLAERTGVSVAPFRIETDYVDLMDGKPRYEGGDSFLRSRGIELAWGSPDDPADRETVCGLGNRKDRFYNEMLGAGVPQVFQTSVDLIRRLVDDGKSVAIVSSSTNCETILAAVGIQNLFKARLDGRIAAERQIAGKPAPDTFVEAARMLGVPPDRTVVVDDTVSGVRAGRAGDFGLVIGVARKETPARLHAGGADVVVADLGDIQLLSDSNHGKEKRTMTNRIGDLPNALTHGDELARRLAGKKLAVFLDYDGTLTPIVDRPEDAIISDSMREAVRGLAGRCSVCVVSGRDRPVVQELMGVDTLIVAGSHGFDIWSPSGGAFQKEMGGEFTGVLEEAKARLHAAMDPIEGALVEPKKASVAAHYRLVADEVSHKIKEVVDAILADHPNELKVTPGKMVFEIQPKIDWDKGKAVLYLLKALDLDGDDVMPMYMGDDHTDEHAFEALQGRGIGVFVGRADDPEVGGRTTYADYILGSMVEVEQFLNGLAR